MKAKWSMGVVLALALAAGFWLGHLRSAAMAQEGAVKIEKLKANVVKVEEGEYKDIFYRRMQYDTKVEVRQLVDQDKKVVCFAWLEGGGGAAELSCVKYGQ